MMIPAARPAQAIDAARLAVMLTMLRLPTIGRLWEGFAVQADKEGWGAARFLAALCEHEIADRDQRRIARHLNESGLPAGKTFATFDFAAVPTLRKAHWSVTAATASPRSFSAARRSRSSPTARSRYSSIAERQVAARRKASLDGRPVGRRAVFLGSMSAIWLAAGERSGAIGHRLNSTGIAAMMASAAAASE
jgi:IstB-like ATP binding protein